MEEVIVLDMNDLTSGELQHDFYANTLQQHLITNHSHIEKPHRHNFYVTILFTHGSGVHEIDFNRYTIEPGSLFLLAPGQMHNWNLSDDVKGYIFFHTQDFFDQFFTYDSIRDYPVFRSSLSENTVVLKGELKDEIIAVFEKLMKEVRSTSWRKDMVVVHLIAVLYIEVNRLLLEDATENRTNHASYLNHFQLFEDLLEKNFKTEKSAAVYASWLNMTQKHLNRICKTLLNQTTTDVITNRVVLEAKRMLMYKEVPFSEISAELGYVEYDYFSKVFKKKVGITPKDFIKKYQ